MDAELIDQQKYEMARAQLGAAFSRILGYFREDGIKSVEQIEAAFRDRNSVALVIPAHTLKGESRQFGSIALGDLAEKIEMTARHLVEAHFGPEELATEVAGLRICFTRTLTELEDHARPTIGNRAGAGGFGRRTALAPLSNLSRN